MSASSACWVSHSMAASRLAFSVQYRAFSARSSGKPISVVSSLSHSGCTIFLTSGGLGSPILRSSGSASTISTSPPEASAITTSPLPELSTEAKNSSVNLSTSVSPLCSSIHFSAASSEPSPFVKCSAFADRILLFPLKVSISSFFWLTLSRNLSCLWCSWLFFFRSSSKKEMGWSSNCAEGSFLIHLSFSCSRKVCLPDLTSTQSCVEGSTCSTFA
mmetsp:Transcript_55147/g.117657  ORF Transcript_55147/g.117657 Transcript_55147/m.117657 type:complete len:217 (-) Transcript_55147:173-823(-)